MIAYVWTRKPKPAEPATWAKTIVGAMAVWVMMALGYGTIPHEWLTFGNSYLNFNTATFVMQQEPLHPLRHHAGRDRSRSAATIIYGIVLTLQVWLFVQVAETPDARGRGGETADD